jgi:predicted dehydrogenase
MDKIRKLRLFQAKQYISLDYTRQDVAVFSLDGQAGTGFPRILTERIAPPRREPLQDELMAFLAAVRGEASVECTGEDSRKALELALQILAQAEIAQSHEIDSR